MASVATIISQELSASLNNSACCTLVPVPHKHAISLTHNEQETPTFGSKLEAPNWNLSQPESEHSHTPEGRPP